MDLQERSFATAQDDSGNVQDDSGNALDDYGNAQDDSGRDSRSGRE